MRTYSFGFFVAAVLIIGASRVATSSAAALKARPFQFSWTGTYDLVGTGFPDGERRAVIHIARADTSYTLASLQGPPGTLVSFNIIGDSAHVVWNLGAEQMLVDLRRAGDSLVGRWATTEWSGELLGFRRR
jgi:hypothetical protein